MSCDTCDFSVRVSETSTHVRRDDGSYELVGHPLERRLAEALTGQAWKTLVAHDRIQYRACTACGNCGAIESYPTAGARARGHIRSIVRRPRAEQFADCRCASCEQSALIPIRDLERAEIRCAVCRDGIVHSTMVARS